MCLLVIHASITLMGSKTANTLRPSPAFLRADQLHTNNVTRVGGVSECRQRIACSQLNGVFGESSGALTR